MAVLDPFTAFHKNRGRCSEIIEPSYHSCRQDHTQVNIKLYIYTYLYRINQIKLKTYKEVLILLKQKIL